MQSTDIGRLFYSNGAISKRCGSQIYLIIVIIIITFVAILFRIIVKSRIYLRLNVIHGISRIAFTLFEPLMRLIGRLVLNMNSQVRRVNAVLIGTKNIRVSKISVLTKKTCVKVFWYDCVVVLLSCVL